MNSPNITFTSCLYRLKNRHGVWLHLKWFRNFIRIVNNFYLVIYTSENDYNVIINEIQELHEDIQQNIKVIVKPFSEFHNYKYERFWIDNNNNPNCVSLYNVSDWRLNMLWCEKVHFVKHTITHNYFDTEYHGWCDIGYFRDTTNLDEMRNKWPNKDKISRLHKDRVYYGCNISDKHLHFGYNYHINHFHPLNLDEKTGIPRNVYLHNAHIISGGFYITGREKALWWCEHFQEILEKYIKNNIVVQNEQHIISHCVFINERGKNHRNPNFCIIKSVTETDQEKLWFMFREMLL